MFICSSESGGTIRWDQRAAVSGGTIKWAYYFEMRYQARQSGGITFYVEVKQRYQVELWDGITI